MQTSSSEAAIHAVSRAWLFSCLARFALRTSLRKKERPLVVCFGPETHRSRGIMRPRGP